MSMVDQIEVPVDTTDSNSLARFEWYLKQHEYKFKKKGKRPPYYYHITINSPMDAFWIGCNLTGIMNADI